ncbi:UNVERIFIED_CONTAM: hypothetical protein Sindi_1941600 [Sesamum indicum]
MSQPKLTSRQAYWQELLSEFHFVMEYRAGSSNHAADALSRRADLESITALSSSAVAISVNDQMRDDVETYVRTCLICQKDKADHQKKAAPKHVTAEGTTHLFFKHIIKYWDLPKDIVSDRDSRFTGVFWIELFKLLGYPEGLGEAPNVVQLYFNAQKSSSTNKSAFEIVTGQQPLLPHTLNTPQSVRSPLARSFSQEWKQNVDIARSCLETALKRMKKYADQNRRFIEFNVENVMLVKIHNVFYVSQLKKYSADKEDKTCNQSSYPQLELMKTKEKVAEAILNHKVTSTAKRDHIEYLVKWRGCDREETLGNE